MGFALARAAREAGAKVTLVAGPTQLASPRGVRRLDVRTAREMHDDVMAYVNHAQVFIAVAAVADWRVSNAAASKLKKGNGAPVLTFEQNSDILAAVAQLPNAPLCVGFAAETDHVIEHARAKLKSKRVQLIVANKAQDAMGADVSEISLVDAQGVTTLAPDAKLAQARRIVAAIAAQLG
jgi:phosphopantothenoylcysteine decarboxylase/phosphopantothenate--cysteine ligase